MARRRRWRGEHLARARAAFDRSAGAGGVGSGGGDAVARGVAMREAGRALALDPALAGAAELVGRLMLEPPRHLPREVLAAMDADAAMANRSQARIALLMSLGYLGFVLPLLGYRGTNLYAAGLAIYVLGNGLLMLLRARGAGAAVLHTPACVALRNAALIAAVGCFYSPFQVGLGLAAVTTAALLSAPLFQRPRSVADARRADAGGGPPPWLGELAGPRPDARVPGRRDRDLARRTWGAAPRGRAASWLALATLLLATVTMTCTSCAGPSARRGASSTCRRGTSASWCRSRGARLGSRRDQGGAAGYAALQRRPRAH